MLRLVGISSATVFRDRRSLDNAYPPEVIFQGKGSVYAYWVTGTGVLRVIEGAESHRIKKLILPHPDTPELQSLESTMGQVYDWPREIRLMTVLAKNIGIDVRWHRQFSGTAMTISNPHSRVGWIHMEPIHAHSTPHHRPIFRFTRRADKKAFRSLWRTYVRTWRHSEAPSEAAIEHEVVGQLIVADADGYATGIDVVRVGERFEVRPQSSSDAVTQSTPDTEEPPRLAPGEGDPET